MSQFLPEGGAHTAPGPLSFTPAVSDADVQLATRVVGTLAARPQQLLAPLMAYILDAIQVSNLLLPISQIVGFSQFAAQEADVSTNESTSSTTFTDLATVGPKLSGLPDGKYVFWWGYRATDLSPHHAALNVNGSTPPTTDPDVEVNVQGAGVTAASISSSRAVTKTLANAGNNTVKVQYRAQSPNTSFYDQRWLIGLKYSN